MYYSQELLVPIWLGLALYIRSWDFGAALPQLSRLQRAIPACLEMSVDVGDVQVREYSTLPMRGDAFN